MTSLIDESSQDREQVRLSLYLVQDDERSRVRMLLEIELCPFELGQIGRKLEVEINSLCPATSDGLGQGGFANLASPYDAHHGKLPGGLV